MATHTTCLERPLRFRLGCLAEDSAKKSSSLQLPSRLVVQGRLEHIELGADGIALGAAAVLSDGAQCSLKQSMSALPF